jgi:hypothetical protein
MTLPFKTHINGIPTNFIQKIWSGVLLNNLLDEQSKRIYLNELQIYNYIKSPIEIYKVLKPKTHTVREDAKNRWKKGNNIHFVVNNRTSRRFQFLPCLEVKNIQKVAIHNLFNDRNGVWIDDIKLQEKELKEFVFNDGFDTIDDFWNFFKYVENDDLKLIHWTDLIQYTKKYNDSLTKMIDLAYQQANY